VYSVSSIVLFVLAALVSLSFAQKGTVLIFINRNLLNFFGWGTLLLPFVLCMGGLMLARLSWKIAQPNVLIGAILIFISSVSLTRSGVFGRAIWFNISELITPVGTGIVLIGSFAIGFTVLFETSIEDVYLFFKSLINFIKKRFVSKKEQQQGLFNKKEANKEEKKKRVVKSKKEQKKTPEPQVEPPDIVPTPKKDGEWQTPPLEILTDSIGGEADRGDLNKNAQVIEETLDSFGVQAQVVEVNEGPAVTQYALKIALGTKLSKITARANDLALALAAPTGQIRVEAPIPGRSLVGIEVPNRSLEIVTLKEMLVSEEMQNFDSKLAFGLGLDVSGEPAVADIRKMPHVLIAGATGAGKSVCINALIATILFRTSPEEVKLLLVDPKRVELTQYNGIPHLLAPVIVEPEKVVSSLKWAISEMERRYKLFAKAGARNITSFNKQAEEERLPYLVIIIDELADVMLFAPSEVEDCITRLAQMARATGIHLVVSTQRPSTDVITGLIKANIPCRIAFNVSSMVDSRVIIDSPGAEKLLGRGDMLYIPPGQAKPQRIQGTFVADSEINALIKFLKKTGEEPDYTEEVTNKYKTKNVKVGNTELEEKDELFEDALRLACKYQKGSASLFQRKLSIGYARAARILDQLEQAGVVGPPDGSKPRELLISNADEFLNQAEDLTAE
jgi:S-DNA-T family DNA segregation ATPase FtsK/SpoIIIE